MSDDELVYRRRLRRIKRGVLGWGALLLAGLEAYHCFVRGMPLVEDLVDWLMGMTIAVVLAQIGFRAVENLQRDPAVAGVVITEHKQLEEALRDSSARIEESRRNLASRVAALEALHHISVAMSSQLEIGALLQFIVEQAVELTNTVGGSILLPDEATGDLVFHAAVEPALTGTRVPAGEGVAARVLREGAPRVVHDVATDPDHYARISQEDNVPVRSLLAVPLLIEDRAIGVLEVVNKRQGRFTGRDRDLLMTLASHAAIAIENARLFRREREQRHLTEALAATATAVSAALHSDQVLETLGAELRRLGLNCWVALLDLDGQALNMRYMSTASRAAALVERLAGVKVRDLRFPREHLATYADLVGAGRPQFVPITMEVVAALLPGVPGPVVERVLRLFDATPGTPAASLPLKVEEQVVGVLTIWGQSLREEEMPALSIFGGQVAAALEVAQLYERAREEIARRRRAEEEATYRAENLKAVNDLAIKLAAAPPTDDLLELVAEQLKAITGALATAISTYDSETQEFVVKYITFGGQDLSRLNALLGQEIVGMRLPVGTDIVERMLTDVIATPEDISEATFGWVPGPVAAAVQKAFGVGALVGLSLHYGGEIMGAALIAMPREQPVFPLEVMHVFAHVAAVSLRRRRAEKALEDLNATLEERVRQRSFDLQVLHDLSRQIGYVRDFDELVHLMLENLHCAISHDVSAGMLVADGRVEIFTCPMRPTTPAVQGEIQERLFSVFARLSGEAIRQGGRRVFTRTLEVEGYDAARAPLTRLGSVFQVPFLVGYEHAVAGLLFVGAERENAFTEEQVRLLYTMANQASLFLSIRRSREALHYRLEFEELITSISTLFIQLASEDVDAGIDFALRAIGEFTGVDRSYVFVLSDDETRLDNTHEWCAQGVASQIENRRGVPVERMSWWMERLGRLQAVHIPRVADLPSEAGAVRRALEQQEVQSVVAVPMVYSQSMVGIVGFDAVRTEKTWTQDAIALLKIVGEIFVNALERKRAAEQILAALQEKEVLLQEVHHRVKNNLQVVSSLLNLQSRYIEDGRTLQMFRESQNRVKTMALIHERLYRAQDLAQVDFGEYVQTLARDLFRSYRAHAGSVTLKVDVEDVFLGVDTAIPCGLIINELVSNALKHAFPDDRDGEVCVELVSDDGQYILAVRDNGVGFPDGLDFRNTETLGLRLVATLVKQLRGTVGLRSDGGTEFEIKFGRPSRARA